MKIEAYAFASRHGCSFDQRGGSTACPAISRAAPYPSPSIISFAPRQDLYFRGLIKDSGSIGKFSHRREPARIDNQLLSVLTATRFILLQSLTSMRGRSLSRCLTRAAASCL